MNLMSSTLLTEDTGVPFHQLQAEQIQLFRDAWKTGGHEREPRVSARITGLVTGKTGGVRAPRRRSGR